MNAMQSLIVRIARISTEIQGMEAFGSNSPVQIREKYLALVQQEATLKNELSDMYDALPRLVRAGVKAQVEAALK